MASTRRRIPLSVIRMKQLEEAHGCEDNWTGITDTKERRKIQNRLHQRAWRKRRAGGNYPGPSRRETVDTTVGPPSSHTSSISQPVQLSLVLRQSLATEVSISSPSAFLIPPVIPYLDPDTTELPTVEFRFPLSPDHYLITLIQYNVLRATLTNIALCSLLHIIPRECRAAFIIALIPTPDTPPPAFKPTPYQLATPHAGWIDAYPCPAFRDNLIRYQSVYDEDDFCDDLLGGLYEGYNDIENRGCLVWGEPWMVDSWEFTQGFVDKWGFLMKGCEDLVSSSNRWRESRGEDRLVVKI